MSRYQNKILLCIFVDSIIIILGSLLAGVVFGVFNSLLDASVFCALNLISLVLFYGGMDLYSHIPVSAKESIISLVLSQIYSFIAVYLIMLFYNPVPILGMLLFAVVCVVCECVFRNWVLKYINSHVENKLLIIENKNSNNITARRIKYQNLLRFDAWYELIDCDDLKAVEKFIAEELCKYQAICLMEHIPEHVRKKFIDNAVRAGIELYVLPDAYDINMVKLHLTRFEDMLTFYIPTMSLNLFNLTVKRIMDVVGSVAMLIVGAIPMIITAILVKATSKGNVFYKQIRLTRGKKEFEILKFRTMVEGAESKTGPVLCTSNDARITPIGKFLRQTRLDELPQLLNVLKGDMSLVGPRPERPFFVEKYEQKIKFYDLRFSVKAGLTSLSHVYGRYSTDIEYRTIYDLMYIRNCNLIMDLRVLLLTSKIIFLKEAAEGLKEDQYARPSKPSNPEKESKSEAC